MGEGANREESTGVERIYYVTPRGEAEPYRVAVRDDGDSWSVTVVRGDEEWSHRLRPTMDRDRVWLGETPIHYRWDAQDGIAGRVQIGGLTHDIRVETEAVYRASALGLGSVDHGQIVDVRAPMPGLVLEVEVESGTSVGPGSGLMIIEAMKMENEITSPVEGVITEIGVSKGEAVEQDALLCRIDPVSVGEEEGDR